MSKVFQKYLIFFILIFIIIISSISASHSQVSFPDTISAYKINYSITLDANFDEECWKYAQKINNFTQREKNNGQPTTERTEAAIVYNDNYIYIGVWCYDREPEKITAKEMNRDFSYWFDDNFEIAFDTYNDNTNGYIFVINPNGARADLQVAKDGIISNRDWNGIWDTKTRIDSLGWFAEIEIPFSTFKYPNKTIQDWGINFERNIRRKQEAAFWQGWARNYDFEHVSNCGKLVGLENIKGKETIEIKPYAKLGFDAAKSQDIKRISNFGADINYLITPTLKLNLSLMTDFAEVESDRILVNLSRFDMYYPEKRDFFLEGSDLFDFKFSGGAYSFYSRRIGLHQSEPIPVLGGVRLMGKVDNTNIGVISMFTDKRDTNEVTNHSVIRIKQEFNSNFNAGVILTSKNNDDCHNHLYGLDFNYSTPSLFGKYKMYLGAAFSQTFDNKDESNNNTAYSFWGVFPNDELSIDFNFAEVQRNYNPGIGFLTRSNYRKISLLTKYKPRVEWGFLRQFIFIPIDFAHYYNLSSQDLESASYSLQPLAFYTESGEYFSTGITRNFENVDNDFNITDKAVIAKGGYWDTRYYLTFQTFEGRDFALGGGINFGDFYSGNNTTYDLNLKYSFNKYTSLSFEYEINNIDLPSSDIRIDNIGTRLRVSFSPQLYSSLFTQWDNLNNGVIMNFRINWIPVIGSDVYFVLNQLINSRSTKEISLENTSALLKVIWRLGL